MIASARASHGGRRWTAMSSGKSGGQRRREIDSIGPGSASSAAPAARSTEARTVATSAAASASSSRPRS